MTTKKTQKKVSKKTTKKSVKKTVVKKPAKKKAVKKVKKRVNKKTYVTIVLDKSGSMNTVRYETIRAFNEQVDVILRNSEELDTVVSLFTFNDQVDTIYWAQPIEELKLLTTEDYVPNGMTAMNDAIGAAISRMELELPDINDPETAVLFVVVTDGEENSSHKFKASDVANLVNRLTETKRWTFSVVGANIDLDKLSDKLNISKGNILKYSANSAGVARSSNAMGTAYANYLQTRGMTTNLQDADLSHGLYSIDNSITDISDEANVNLPDPNIK